MKTDDLREAYLEFFASKGCVRKPSDVLAPNDPTVLFTPAGMNQFELEGRLLPGQDPFGPDPKPARADEEDEEGDEIFTFAPDEVPFYEVIEVELEGVE